MSKSGLNSDQLKNLIREVPDFPKKGILFYDITTLLKDKAGYATLIDVLAERYIGKGVDLILGDEGRDRVDLTGGNAGEHRIGAQEGRDVLRRHRITSG